MKTKFRFSKQLISTMLCVLLIFTYIPLTAQAVTYNGNEVKQIYSRTVSGQGDTDNTSLIRVYVTDENAITVTPSDIAGKYQFKLDWNNNEWYFDGWQTWYDGSRHRPIISDVDVSGSNPTIEDGGLTYYFFFNESQRSAYSKQTNFIFIYQAPNYYGNYYLYAIFKPIVTVDAGNGVTYTLSTPNSNKISDNKYGVKYKDDVTINYQIDNKYVLTSASVSGTQYYDISDGKIVLNDTEKPTSVGISTRLKQQKVNFNANGGDGTMETQTFNYGEAKTLTANSFVRNDHVFTGWNTKEDGSGTEYTDEQSLTFTPATDGESITLYAQWTECAEHNWGNGVCIECGTECVHSGGLDTCTEKAICSICNTEYGQKLGHNYTYIASENVITEICTNGCNHNESATIMPDIKVSATYNGSAIEGLKVSYSDNWQGGNPEISYSNNINAGMASGSITIDNATATLDFEIIAKDMTGISAKGYSGTYDGENHSISVTAPDGATVTYKTGNGEYSTTKPTFKNVGTYTVSYKVTKANHNDYTGSAEVKITKAKLTVTAEDKTVTYGEEAPRYTVLYDGFKGTEIWDSLSGILAFDCDYEQFDDAGEYTITPKGLTSDNYDIQFESGKLTVLQKEIDISWDATQFLPYNGESKTPMANAVNLISDDICTLTTDVVETDEGAGIIPGTWTAKVTGLSNPNYKLPENGARVEVPFTVVYGSQNVPPQVTGQAETIFKKGDGKIVGLTTAMEYATVDTMDDSAYTKVTDPDMNFDPGTYYVRYAAYSYYKASYRTEVTIDEGRKLKVNIPQEQIGYTLTVDKTELEYMSGFTITLNIADDYVKTEQFAVKLNGKDMQWGDQTQMGVQGCFEDIEITVEGVETIIVPGGEAGSDTAQPDTPSHTETEPIPQPVTVPDTTVKDDTNPENPKTGVDSNMTLWLILLIVGGMGIATTNGKKKKYSK